MLTPEYFVQARRRALRFSGCLDCGTSGALAGDVLRLLAYIDANTKRSSEMDASNAAASVAIPSDWILRGDSELRQARSAPPDAITQPPAGEARLRGDGLMGNADESPAERLLRDAVEITAARRAKYSPPQEHFARTVGAINAIFASKLREPLTVGDWAQIMILDKLARHQGQPQRDNQLDAAGYAACWAEADPQP
jgi:hypothetical protein